MNFRKVPDGASPEEVAAYIMLSCADFITSIPVTPGETGLEYKSRILNLLTEVVSGVIKEVK